VGGPAGIAINVEVDTINCEAILGGPYSDTSVVGLRGATTLVSE
jgi:hypothetical protein